VGACSFFLSSCRANQPTNEQTPVVDDIRTSRFLLRTRSFKGSAKEILLEIERSLLSVPDILGLLRLGVGCVCCVFCH